MKLLVLDGNSILNRAFYGIKQLSTKQGEFTNGIYGFLKMFSKIREVTSPDAVAIAFDVKQPTFRHQMYSGYKANRKGMPPELASQLPVLKELLCALGYNIITAPGWEADDILGTLAARCRRDGNECVIATGDRDSLQLVGGGVTVYMLATKMGRPEARAYDSQAIMDEYGVTPSQLIDIKAIQGDTSDNIPGVAGIGQKGAAELVIKFGSLKNIYDNIDSPELKASHRTKLEASKEMAYLSYELGTIRTDAPVEADPNKFIPAQPDIQKVTALMTRLEFFSLLKEMNLEPAPCEVKADTGFVKINNETRPDELLQRIKAEKRAIFAYSFDGDKIDKLAFAFEGEVAVIAPQREFLSALMEDKEIIKIAHDIKRLYRALLKENINMRSVGFDFMLAAYLLDPDSSSYDLTRLFDLYGIGAPESEEQGDDFALTAARLPALLQKMEEEIASKGMERLFFDIEIPLARVLAHMESVGFLVDKEGIEAFGQELAERITTLEEEIYALADTQFNINSPKQLGTVLFEKLQLPSGKKTKTGYSTSAEVLERLRGVSPVVDKVLEYRSLSKLKSTYCDGLVKAIGEDGRIHSCFNQTETRTGRISSTEPNLQNIPIRTELGSRMRGFFTAKEGCVLCDADYSQIELRVLAHMADDRVMTEAFIRGDDIHTITASQVFGVPTETVTSQMRSRAKAVNFGIVYGIGAFSLAKDINVSNAEASRYIKAYLEHYSGVNSYMEHTVATAKDLGYAQTLYGRRRQLPELSSSNHNLRAFGERVARNMPIQGTAADIIKIAMIRVHNRLEQEKLSARLILQVHDELIVEAPDAEKERVIAILSEEMAGAADLRVPLPADAHWGKNWLETK